MANELLTSLMKKAMVSAATAAGGKLGSLVATEVLRQLNLQGDQLGDLQAEVAAVDRKLTRIESRLAAIEHSLAWLTNDAIFSAVAARVATIARRAQAIDADRSYSDEDRREKMVALLDEADATRIETDLTALHDMIMGNVHAIQTGESLFATMFRTHWSLFHDPERSMTIEDAADIATGIYARLAQLQGDALGLCMLRHTLKGNGAQARSVNGLVWSNLWIQWKELCEQSPDMLVWLLTDLETDGNESSNWSFTFKTTQSGPSEKWFAPDIGIYVETDFGTDLASALSATPLEINVVPYPNRPGRFYLRRTDTWKSMGFSSSRVISHAPTLAHPDPTGTHTRRAGQPVYSNVMVPLMDLASGTPATPVQFFMTGHPDVYAFGWPESIGMVTVQHWGQHPSLYVRAHTGERDFDLYQVVALTALHGRTTADVRKQATTWTIRCAPGASRTRMLAAAGF